MEEHVHSRRIVYTADQILQWGLETIRVEEEGIRYLPEVLKNSDFPQIVQEIFRLEGKVVVSGVGKSALIAQKIVATMNSTGTRAVFLHAGDAVHGDVGIVEEKDHVLILSNSGETQEIRVLLPVLKNFGVRVSAITSRAESYLATHADYRIVYRMPREACPHNLAPTTSTTLQLMIGDAIAMTLVRMYGFSAGDFARLHPGGTLGKKLYLRVADIYPSNPRPRVYPDTPVLDVIVRITEGRLGAVAVLDSETEHVVGIITDGDIRRMIQHYPVASLSRLRARDIMSSPPRTIEDTALAVEALDRMRKHKIMQLIVTDASGKQYLGMIHMHDLVREGIV